MSIDVNGIKHLILECMQELKEASGCGGVHPAQEGGFTEGPNEYPDPDQYKGMWKSFKDEALGPDDRFRRNYVLQALGDNPKILESILGALDEDQELQEELYDAVEGVRKSRRE